MVVLAYMFWHAALLCSQQLGVGIFLLVCFLQCKFRISSACNLLFPLVRLFSFSLFLFSNCDLLCFVSHYLKLYFCWINYSWDTGGDVAFVEITFMLVFVRCEIIIIGCSFRVEV